MNPSQTLPIRPEILAGKFAAARNLSQPRVAAALAQEPRLSELLWWLQALSWQPGGLDTLRAEIIKTHSRRLGPAPLVNIKSDKLTGPQCLMVWDAMPRSHRVNLAPAAAWETRTIGTWEYEYDSDKITPEERRELQYILYKLNRPAFEKAALRAAEDNLTQLLASWCNEVDCAFDSIPWYFADVRVVLFEVMEQHARQASARLAMTEVALKVFDALQYAVSEKVPVQIHGDSRFGKTEAVKTFCAMRPGQARLVKTPCSNCDADLYRAVADALCLEHDLKTTARELKEKVEYIVCHSGLCFVFDEAHFLLPTRFSANTVPFRLNWIRTRFIDSGVAIVLVNTPQAYGHAVSKFTKATGHNIQQFIGRIMHNVVLPNELERDDLLAVAKIHFPELNEDFLLLIIAKAMQSESFLMAVDAIARRARYVSKRDGHAKVTLADLKLAIGEVVPGAAAPAAALPTPALPTPRRSRAARPAPPVAAAPALNIVRDITPAPAPLTATNRVHEPELVNINAD